MSMGLPTTMLRFLGKPAWKCPRCGVVFTLPMEKEEVSYHTTLHKLRPEEFLTGFGGSVKVVQLRP